MPRVLFQSSSSPKTGCYKPVPVPLVWMVCFNPHPVRRLDATECHYIKSYKAQSFNPHPVRRLDATLVPPGWAADSKGFNPHPVRRLDATCRPYPRAFSAACFNPHPVRRLDATYRIVTTGIKCSVSILIQSEDWMLHTLMLCLFENHRSFNPHPVRRLDATSY